MNCHEIFISDQILPKLEVDVDEYLYSPYIGTKHIKVKGKEVLEALIQRYCLHEIPSMINISMLLCETTNVFIDAFLLFLNLFQSIRIISYD